jgi:alanine dehydrogenase
MKLGLIREEKIPQDKRVALTPEQCSKILQEYQTIKIFLQPSPNRCFLDAEYESAGVIVQEALSDCDVLLGIKEVPFQFLIPNKTYCFFSHTIKKQAYNKRMLQEILKKNIRLMDYECMVWQGGGRVIGFGRFAGIVGAHNAIWTYANKLRKFSVPRAHQVDNLEELLQTYKGLTLPAFKIAVLGDGRVAHGAMELLEKTGVREVTSRAFIRDTFDVPVYVHLRIDHLYESKDHKPFDKAYFYHNPEQYFSVFYQFFQSTDILINAIYWDEKIPIHFTLDQMKSPDFNIQVIADITCDINGSIPSTVESTTIDNPVYGWDRQKELKTEPFLPETVDMMTIGNLPCELPKDASEEFGELFCKYILPAFVNNDSEGILKRATITEAGHLTPNFSYLSDYVSG